MLRVKLWRRVSVAVAAFGISVAPLAAQTEDQAEEQADEAQPAYVAECQSAEDLASKIIACTSAIQFGKQNGEDVAWAYQSRGWAHYSSGDFRRAIADFEDVLQDYPQAGSVYFGRGLAHEGLFDFAAAIPDYERSVAIEGEARIKWWQELAKTHGHYAGEVDGAYSVELRAAMVACSLDPKC